MKKEFIYILIFNLLMIIAYVFVSRHDSNLAILFFPVIINIIIANVVFKDENKKERYKLFLFLPILYMVLYPFIMWHFELLWREASILWFAHPSSESFSELFSFALLFSFVLNTIPSLIVAGTYYATYNRKSKKMNEQSENIGIKYFWNILYILIIVIILIISFNPMKRSIDRIRNDVLRITPIGTHKYDVLEIIEVRSEWDYPRMHGYVRDFTRYNQTSIWSVIGEYRDVVLEWHVKALWIFDEEGNLKDVAIRKAWK